jgi:tryptophan-rich sensory protein
MNVAHILNVIIFLTCGFSIYLAFERYPTNGTYDIIRVSLSFSSRILSPLMSIIFFLFQRVSISQSENVSPLDALYIPYRIIKKSSKNSELAII